MGRWEVRVYLNMQSLYDCISAPCGRAIRLARDLYNDRHVEVMFFTKGRNFLLSPGLMHLMSSRQTLRAENCVLSATKTATPGSPGRRGYSLKLVEVRRKSSFM